MSVHEPTAEGQQPSGRKDGTLGQMLDRPLVAHSARKRIEHVLQSRLAPKGTTAARIESLVKDRGERLWAQLKRHPSLGVATVAGLGFAAATAIGVGELSFGIAAGYAAYQVLKRGISVSEALKEAKSIVD